MQKEWCFPTEKNMAKAIRGQMIWLLRQWFLLNMLRRSSVSELVGRQRLGYRKITHVEFYEMLIFSIVQWHSVSIVREMTQWFCRTDKNESWDRVSKYGTIDWVELEEIRLEI